MLISLLAAAAMHRQTQSPPPMWGLTIDNVAQINNIVPALAGFKKKPTVRVAFDPDASPAEYIPVLKQLAPVANIMGEPIDSAPPSGNLSVGAYWLRMAQYMEQLGPLVNIWEIGNEVNGDWTCPSPEMATKIADTFNEAQSLKAQTALTLFYSSAYTGTDREMVAWSKKYLSATVRNGVNYVLVSYYATSVAGGPSWADIFKSLAATFPNAYIGFGELGLVNADGTLSTDPVAKAQLIRRFYPMGSQFPGRFIYGFFWWTFVEDAVPINTGLWSTFNAVIH